MIGLVNIKKFLCHIGTVQRVSSSKYCNNE